MRETRKIVVIGPESTGKSTLCECLAAHYQTTWVPEYAREYLLANGNRYTYEDLLTIAKGQLEREDEIVSSGYPVVSGVPGVNGELSVASDETMREEGAGKPHSLLTTHNSIPIFIDTDMYVMKVWSEFVFGRCHQWILDRIVSRRYDLYLLCNTDLPWVKDELREYPDLATREKLFHIYKDLLVNQDTPWAEISGDNGQRLQKAIEAVDGGR